MNRVGGEPGPATQGYDDLKEGLTVALRIDIDRERIAAFCRKWRVKELSLFGSVLTDDFRPDSDVDVLVVFDDSAPWSLWDMVTMQEELQEIFGRQVDLVEKRALRNPFRKHHILKTHEVIHAE